MSITFKKNQTKKILKENMLRMNDFSQNNLFLINTFS